MENNIRMIVAKVKLNSEEYKEYETKVDNNCSVATEYVTNLVFKNLKLSDKFSFRNIPEFSSYNFSKEVKMYLTNEQFSIFKRSILEKAITYSEYISNLISDDLKGRKTV
jgi:hypothetical protein